MSDVVPGIPSLSLKMVLLPGLLSVGRKRYPPPTYLRRVSGSEPVVKDPSTTHDGSRRSHTYLDVFPTSQITSSVLVVRFPQQ